jgi:hypothetical protein
MYTKSLTSGAQISSYFEAMSIAVTPTCKQSTKQLLQSDVIVCLQDAKCAVVVNGHPSVDYVPQRPYIIAICSPTAGACV